MKFSIQNKTHILRNFTRDLKVLNELEKYTQNHFEFDWENKSFLSTPDELQVSEWEGYVQEAKELGTYPTLKKYLISFRFPIQAGISQTSVYRAATLRGQPTTYMKEASGLELEEAGALNLHIYASIAGNIPVLEVGNENDFIRIIQALAYKNEPMPIPYSMGASMISGLNNWNRIKQLRDEWIKDNPNENWPRFFRQSILPYKSLYQDRLIVVSNKPYSGVKGGELGVEDDLWLRYSLTLRLAHECAHYFTLSYLGGMFTHLHDEFIADYMGITKVLKEYNAKWFHAFMGIGNYADKGGGRFENYLQKSSLSQKAKEVLQDILIVASNHATAFHHQIKPSQYKIDRISQLISLASLGLAELASPDACEKLVSTYRRITENFPIQG